MTFPAMIFAAGFGTRMGLLTRSVPKPMVPLAGRPMIDHAIDLLTDAGVDRIVANIHYLHEVIEPHLAHKEVHICHGQPDILDTGGGLKAALPWLGGDIAITLNPDAAWLGVNPVQQLLSAWQPEMQALLLLVPLANAQTQRETGDFSLEQGEIQRTGSLMYSGAQIIRTTDLSQIDDAAFSLNRYWDLLAQKAPLNGIVYGGQWADIGTPEGLSSAEKLLGHV